MFLLIAGHEKGYPRLQQGVPWTLGDWRLAAVDGLDSFWIGDRKLSGS